MNAGIHRFGIAFLFLILLGGCSGSGFDGDLPQGVEIGNPSGPSGTKNILIVLDEGSTYRAALSDSGNSKISEISRFAGDQPLVPLSGGEVQPIYGQEVLDSAPATYTVQDETVGLSAVLPQGKEVVLSLTWDDNGQISQGSFSINGRIVAASFFVEDYRFPHAAALDPDGKIVITGYSLYYGSDWDYTLSQLFIMRLNPDGSPDENFGLGGFVLEGFGTEWAEGNSIVALSDGKLLVAGTFSAAGRAFLARFLHNGTLDPTFGEDGLILFDFFYAFDLKVQEDGKILVATYHGDLLRFLPDGGTDSSFGEAGYLGITSQTYIASRTEILPAEEGKVLVAAIRNDYSWDPCSSSKIILRRYLSDGTLDPSFSESAVWDFASRCVYTYSLALKRFDDGGILIGGSYQAGEADDYATGVYLTKFSVDGAFDASFGDGGVVLFDTPSQNSYEIFSHGTDVEPLPENQIMASALLYNKKTDLDFGLIRFLSDGNADESFGNDGLVGIDIGKTSDQPQVLLRDSDGSVVIVGSSENDVAVVRYFE